MAQQAKTRSQLGHVRRSGQVQQHPSRTLQTMRGAGNPAGLWMERPLLGQRRSARLATRTYALEPMHVSTLLSLGVLSVSAGSYFWMMARTNGLGSNFAFRRVKESGVSFADVAGVQDAKEQLREVVAFLKEPALFMAMGAKIPRGILLEGPPGTGKTLLAKAVAGEAGVPFFAVSASEFVELYVGVGAKRVREAFERGRKNAPCIIFIDELDSVGRQRGTGANSAGNQEQDQTLNQLLTELDGFNNNSNVIVIAATNLVESLDSALLRPGRFDRRITIALPEVADRLAILQTHGRTKALGDNADLASIARRTPGFSGADLANLLNEAAIMAVRNGATHIADACLEEALERVTNGVERRGVTCSEAHNKLVACHEAGHALVGYMLPNFDTVKKVSIVPRGKAAGLTSFEPSEERATHGIYTREYLEAEIAVALAGRLAEEAIYGEQDATTGASSDLQYATELARSMVENLGFDAEIGLRVTTERPGILGPRAGSDTLNAVDRGIAQLVERGKVRARAILDEHRHILEALRDALVLEQNISAPRLKEIIDAAATL